MTCLSVAKVNIRQSCPLFRYHLLYEIIGKKKKRKKKTLFPVLKNGVSIELYRYFNLAALPPLLAHHNSFHTKSIKYCSTYYPLERFTC